MAGANLGSIWEGIADVRADRPALFHGDLTRTWGEFEDRGSRLASVLGEAGVTSGDNVALALFNGPEYLEAELAAFKCRAAPCNVNYRYVENELRHLVDDSDAKAVFFDHALGERFDNVVAQLPKVQLWVHVGDGPCPDWAVGYEDVIAAADPAPRIDRSDQDLWILYTGGTTGNPKGVMWPHSSLAGLVNRSFAPLGIDLPQSAAQVPAMVDAIDALGNTPRQLAAAPLMHGTSGLGALFTLFQGGSVVTLTGRQMDAHDLWRTAVATETTTVSIVGDVFCRPMVEALDEAAAAGDPYDLTALGTVVSSGVMWSQPIKDRLLAHAAAVGTTLTLRDSLGASEGVGFGSRVSTGDDDTTTASFALGPEAAVFTDNGERVVPGSGEVGLLAVGGAIPLGYYGDPVKSAETFKEIQGSRWSIPGDFATVEADGAVTLLGRGSVSINTGGEKVFPEEVEEALKLLPQVVDATVVGVPDPKWGAVVTAIVQLAEGREPDTINLTGTLIDALRTNLSGYKLPKHIVPVEKVFRGPNGKADYTWATAVAMDALGID